MEWVSWRMGAACMTKGKFAGVGAVILLWFMSWALSIGPEWAQIIIIGTLGGFIVTILTAFVFMVVKDAIDG